MHCKASWNLAALDWKNGAAFQTLLVELDTAGAYVLAVTEVVAAAVAAAVVAVSVKAGCSRWSEAVAVVAFQLLEQVESTFVVVELDLGVYATVHVLPMPAAAAAGEYY